jgi:phage-related holin
MLAMIILVVGEAAVLYVYGGWSNKFSILSSLSVIRKGICGEMFDFWFLESEKCF